jgi:L-lactate dehydrogenase complex protein LldG
MTVARATILERIRRSRVAVTAPRPACTAPLPVVGDDLVAAFTQRARKLSSDVVGPVTAAQAPMEVLNYLATHALPPRAVCWPALTGHDWAAAGITTEARAARGDDLVGITGSCCAIAETGTLMLLSGPDTPASVSLLPETHVALVPVSRLVARMEDAWALLRREHETLPRAVNFISGPSRTADIEQIVTLGAHGPYRVLIVLISE